MVVEMVGMMMTMMMTMMIMMMKMMKMAKMVMKVAKMVMRMVKSNVVGEFRDQHAQGGAATTRGNKGTVVWQQRGVHVAVWWRSVGIKGEKKTEQENSAQCNQ